MAAENQKKQFQFQKALKDISFDAQTSSPAIKPAEENPIPLLTPGERPLFLSFTYRPEFTEKQHQEAIAECADRLIESFTLGDERLMDSPLWAEDLISPALGPVVEFKIFLTSRAGAGIPDEKLNSTEIYLRAERTSNKGSQKVHDLIEQLTFIMVFWLHAHGDKLTKREAPGIQQEDQGKSIPIEQYWTCYISSATNAELREGKVIFPVKLAFTFANFEVQRD